jgi:uncharacterized protein
MLQFCIENAELQVVGCTTGSQYDGVPMTEIDQSGPLTTAFVPIAPQERMDALDILRGFALFGILWVNMPEGGRRPIDVFFGEVSNLLATGKFITIFGFLFGVSFSLQWLRATEHGREPTLHSLRRLAILFLIGVLHHVLVWDGDILTTYALLGAYLLVVQRLRFSQRTILALALCLLAVIIVRGEVELTRRTTREVGAATHRDITGTQLREGRQRMALEEVQSYTATSYAQGVRERWEELTDWLQSRETYIPGDVFVFFLLGLWAARSGILRDAASHGVLLCRIVRWGLPLGVTFFFAALVSHHMLYSGRSTWLADSVFRAAGFVGRPILGFSYVAGILLLLQKEHWRRRLGPLKHAGRMALTNYLMQSLVFTAVSHSYGLGIYSKLTGVTVLLYTLVFFSAQVYLSRWWLSRFRFGPAEWVWRSLTYGALMPWRA